MFHMQLLECSHPCTLISLQGPFTIHFTQNLTNLAALVRQEIPKLIRNILGAKITIDVHLRDICSELVKKQVTEDTCRSCIL